MSPSLIAYCTFIRPPTSSASASARGWRSSCAMALGPDESGGQRRGGWRGVCAGLLGVPHGGDGGGARAAGRGVDVAWGGGGERAADQRRALGRDHEPGGSVEIAGEPRDVTVELGGIEYDLHGAPAE